MTGDTETASGDTPEHDSAESTPGDEPAPLAPEDTGSGLVSGTENALDLALDESPLIGPALPNGQFFSHQNQDDQSGPSERGGGGWNAKPQDIDPFSGAPAVTASDPSRRGRASDPYSDGAPDQRANPFTGVSKRNPYIGADGAVIPDRIDKSPDLAALGEYYRQQAKADAEAAARQTPAPQPGPPPSVVPAPGNAGPGGRGPAAAGGEPSATGAATMSGTSTQPTLPPPPSPAIPSIAALPPPTVPLPDRDRPTVPVWTTQTEWSFRPPDPRLIQPVTHYDSGNAAVNVLMNKVILPWRNALAFAENIPLAFIVGVDDALKHSAAAPEYQAAQDLLPLEGAMGLAFEAGPALDYAVTRLTTSPAIRNAVTAPAYWFLGAGGVGGGSPSAAAATRSAAAASLAVDTLPKASGLINPRAGEEKYVANWIYDNLVVLGDEATLKVTADPRGAAEAVPPRMPYLSVQQYGGFVWEYALKKAVESRPILNNILRAVEHAEQMVPGGRPDLVLREPFNSMWGLRPWDATTEAEAVRKAAAGVDYVFVTYYVDWFNLGLWRQPVK